MRFTTGDRGLPVFNSFLQLGSHFFKANSDTHLSVLYLQLFLTTIYISQGSVAANRNHFSYFKQKEIKYKELGAYKMLAFWED